MQSFAYQTIFIKRKPFLLDVVYEDGMFGLQLIFTDTLLFLMWESSGEVIKTLLGIVPILRIKYTYQCRAT